MLIKAHLKLASFAKEHWIRRKLEGQWTDAFSTEVVTYFSRYNIDATDYRVPTDQLLTEANEVLDRN
jgi:hypothetical protein